MTLLCFVNCPVFTPRASLLWTGALSRILTLYAHTGTLSRHLLPLQSDALSRILHSHRCTLTVSTLLVTHVNPVRSHGSSSSRVIVFFNSSSHTGTLSRRSCSCWWSGALSRTLHSFINTFGSYPGTLSRDLRSIVSIDMQPIPSSSASAQSRSSSHSSIDSIDASCQRGTHSLVNTLPSWSPSCSRWG